MAELTEAAAGRADLLAERAGTALGFGADRPDTARYRQIAELCIAAGADQALIERWIKVGRDRAAVAAAIPYTGLPPGGSPARVTGFDELRQRSLPFAGPVPDAPSPAGDPHRPTSTRIITARCAVPRLTP